MQNFCKICGRRRIWQHLLCQKSGSIKNNNRERRFIVYSGIVEASKVPQEWNAWLHHVTNDLPKKKPKLSWMKDHLPNMTGTPYAYEYKDQKKIRKNKKYLYCLEAR